MSFLHIAMNTYPDRHSNNRQRSPIKGTDRSIWARPNAHPPVENWRLHHGLKAAKQAVLCASTLLLVLAPALLDVGISESVASEAKFQQIYADADNAFIDGNLDLSQSLLEQATKELGSSDVEQLKLADCLEKQALINERQSQLQEAANKLERAISVRCLKSWPEHPAVIEDRTRLVDLYTRLKQPARAVACSAINLDAKKKLYGSSCARLTKEHGKLAQALEQLGENKKAAEEYTQMYRCLLTDPSLWDSQIDEYIVGMLCLYQKQGGEYQSKCQPAIQQLIQHLPPSDENPDRQVADKLDVLSRLIQPRGQLSLARDLMQLALDRREKLQLKLRSQSSQANAEFAQNNKDMAFEEEFLAVVHNQLKDYATAAKLASMAIERASTDKSFKEKLVPLAASTLASSRMAIRDFDGARKACAEGLSVLHGNETADINLKRDLLGQMMGVYVGQSQWRQAEPFCVALLKLIEQHPGIGSRAGATAFLAGLVRNGGDVQRSQPLFQQAINIKLHDGVEDFELGEFYLALGDNYCALHQFEKANQAYRHALQLVDKPGIRPEVRKAIIEHYSAALRQSGQVKKSEEIAALLTTKS